MLGAQAHVLGWQKSTGRSAGNCGSAASITLQQGGIDRQRQMRAVLLDGGHGQHGHGVSAAWPLARRCAKSRVVRSAQKREGKAKGRNGSHARMVVETASRSGAPTSRYHRPMTEELFRQDARLHACSARITAPAPTPASNSTAPCSTRWAWPGGDSGVLVLDDGSPSPSPTRARPRMPTASPPEASCMSRPPGKRRCWRAWHLGPERDRPHRRRAPPAHDAPAHHHHLLCRLVMVPHLVNGCSITPDMRGWTLP